MLQQDSLEDGKLLGHIRAVKVTLGDPNLDLFRVPKDAKVVTTLEFGKAMRTFRALPKCESCEAQASVPRKTTNQMPLAF